MADFDENIQDYQNGRLSQTQADNFARQLRDLCKRHGVMLWTGLKTQPMHISAADEDDVFHYVARPCEGNPNVFTVRRVIPR